MSGKKQPRALFTCRGICKVLEFLDLESLHSHRLALVPGPVDDGATPTLAQDGALILAVLQLAVLQEEPARNTVCVPGGQNRPPSCPVSPKTPAKARGGSWPGRVQECAWLTVPTEQSQGSKPPGWGVRQIWDKSQLWVGHLASTSLGLLWKVDS